VPQPLLVQTGTEDLIFDGDHEWREQAPAAFLDRWLAVSPA
jgi:hypothetical protein